MRMCAPSKSDDLRLPAGLYNKANPVRNVAVLTRFRRPRTGLMPNYPNAHPSVSRASGNFPPGKARISDLSYQGAAVPAVVGASGYALKTQRRDDTSKELYGAESPAAAVGPAGLPQD